MTPAEILRKAADELEAGEQTFLLALGTTGGHAIYQAAGQKAVVAMPAMVALGREYRDEEVRRLRAAAAKLDGGDNPLLFTTSRPDVGKFRR